MHEQVPGQNYGERVRRMRVEKEMEFLKSLNRNYHLVGTSEIVVQRILHDGLDLHIYLPSEYPFHEPQYSIAGRQRIKVSEVLAQWVPKLKILEVIELVAIRIDQQKAFQERVSQYILLRGFLKSNSLPIIILLAVLLRILVGLGSYSGMHDYPQLGDFEAHRNWMSITLHRPISSWYEELEDTIWWRIDYPPVAAYLSFFFGKIYNYWDPQALEVQNGYESESLKSYMRFTVLFVDLVFLFPPLVLLAKSIVGKQMWMFFLIITLFKPDVILIDHGHFQYNSLILGLILTAFYLIKTKNYYLACILYTIAVHSKQMAVYYALAFLGGLIGLTFSENKHNKAKVVVQLLKYALIVLTVSLIIWAPWLTSTTALESVITAIFPVHRGLYQLKVANFWCITDILFKWQAHFSKPILLVLCGITSLLASIPSFICLVLKPNQQSLIVGFATISMSFYMFSYHVHQKSILLPLLLVPLLGEVIGGSFAHDLIIAGCLGMFHLLKEDQQQLGYFAILIIFYFFSNSYRSLAEDAKQIRKIQEGSTVLTFHRSFYEGKVIRAIMLALVIGLHLCEKTIAPPTTLPYLHHLLFAFFSFTMNAYLLLLGNSLQIEWVWRLLKEKQEKRG